jgi:alpha-L-arabinofuranosidase
MGKALGWFAAFVCLVLAAALNAPAADGVTVTIGVEKLSRAPIDRNIYGAVLEHIGQQMDIMWAELLQDNSFEGLRPFNEHTENWAEGKVDSSRFWWHSGYELHPWRAFGEEKSATVATSFGNNMVNGLHGKIVNNASSHAAGIAQDGIPVKAGMTYKFEAYLSPTGIGRRVPGADATVTIGLYADSALTKPYARAAIALKTAGLRKYSAVLRVPETSDNATFALAVEPKGFAAMDLISLMPADNFSGWRADVVSALKDMGLHSYRYPGGCFASFVDWETMVGPPEQRVPYTNPYWGGLEPNHVGTDEFLRLMELVKGEPLLCINMLTGTPQHAADWVAYTNGGAGTHYGSLRARNGHPKPYGVKYWELDNEAQRRFSAEQYADQCRLYSAKMKAVDPSIRLSAIGYFWNAQELELLVKRAAPAIDLLSVRTTDAGELAAFESLLDKYSTPQHQIRIADTEWRNRFKKDAWVPLRVDGSLRRAEATWSHGLECARTYQEFQRRAGSIRMAMFPSVSNLYGEDFMSIGKSGIVYTCSGRVAKLMSDMMGNPVQTTIESAAGKLDVNAVVDERAGRLVATAVNGEAAAIPLRLDLRAWKRLKLDAKTITLTASTPNAMSDFHTPDSVRQSETAVHGNAGIFTAKLPPYSVNKTIFELERPLPLPKDNVK